MLYALVAVGVVLALKLLATPIKWGLKLLLNTGLGLLLLFVFNWIADDFGMALGLNLSNALIVGIFGPFGLVLLLFFRWALLL